MTMNANTTELKVTDLYRYEQTATLGKIDTRSIVERNNDAVKREQLVAKCSEYRGKVSTVVLASASIKELEELLAYLQNTYVLEGYRMTFTEFSLALRHYGVTKVYLTEEGMQNWLTRSTANMHSLPCRHLVSLHHAIPFVFAVLNTSRTRND